MVSDLKPTTFTGGPDPMIADAWVKDMEKIIRALPYTERQKRIRTAQSRQKSYADTRRRDLEFQVGDHVFLRISPTRGVIRFGKRGKLNLRYIGPFEILEMIGPVAYRLALPPELSNIHNVFHVSMIRQYLRDLKHVVDYEDLEVQEDLSYKEQPVQILDRHDQVLRNKTIPLVKVLW
ncbi:uncharacterized protein LOC114303512 [Camellia sinensis]|uniref:uncharacterized protein LOC114303512 n=1 Tax=Camellia sinensis TaxID=4442 RepID=UPI001035D15C|nr:uncharacterized protein LOC114303512 [Camellia sinensis]